MTLFQNKYRIESNRHPTWDYGNVGYYFITVCTKNMVHFFGTVTGNSVDLSPLGKIVANEWIKTGLLRDNLELDEWIIMPNHVHVIASITYKVKADPNTRTSRTNQHPRTRAASEKWAANTIGSILGQFKGSCTREIRKVGYPQFQWQANYYDHIIRNNNALQAIRRYIINNPSKWYRDKNNGPMLYT